MLILLLGVTLATVLFYYFIVKPFSYWTERGVKQGKPMWIVGDNWGPISQTQSFPEMIQMIYNQCPGTRYSGAYQFFTPTLVLKDPELLKQITVKDFDHFTDHRPFATKETDPLLSQNLFNLKGQSWREMRAILSPSFTSSKMKEIFVLMAECAENFVKHFMQKDEDIVTVEMKDAFTRFANDVIATAAFGVNVDSLDKPNNEFYLMGKDATDFSTWWKNTKLFAHLVLPKLCVLLNIKLLKDEVNDFFLNLVTETVKVRQEKGIVRRDMIHLLMEARKGNQKVENGGKEKDTIDSGFATTQDSHLGTAKKSIELNDADIAAQGFVFFFAGSDTVSSLMCFSSYELALNQDVQNRLRKEIYATFKECGGKLTYDALMKMKYMDMVISEGLRKWPNGAAIDRVCTKPYTIQPVTPDEKAVYLEKGSVLWLPIFGVHRDPNHFPDPERFDPERFNDENKGNIKPYTYFPFGLGPRNCIGSKFALLEAKVLIFYILLHFETVPVEKTSIPLVISKKDFNLSAEGGFWFGLKRIKK